MIISELNVSDGQIIEFTIATDVATIVLKDWKDQVHKLVFNNIVGVEAYSPEFVDLCHIKETTDSEQLRKLRSIIEAEEDEIIEYSFIAAWNDLPILSIFGESVEIKS